MKNIVKIPFMAAITFTAIIISVLLTSCASLKDTKDKENVSDAETDTVTIRTDAGMNDIEDVETQKNINGKDEAAGGDEKSLNETSSDDEDEYKQEDDIMEEDRYYDQAAAAVGEGKDNCFMEPILQNPTENGVTVEWFTEYPGKDSSLYLYDGDKSEAEEDEPARIIKAKTFKLSRLRGGKTDADKNNAAIDAGIYKHVAIADGLPDYHGYISERRPYKVVTDDESSGIYTLAACPAKGTPLRVLLTSDHQNKAMVAANIQKAYETAGPLDAIFMDGDIADVADRCYDWFYADNAFFRYMTGTARSSIGGTVYYGAPLLQETPIYTAIGNHDVMGVYDGTMSLADQFNNPRTRQQAEAKWEASGLTEGHDSFIEDNSYNTITYEEMFEQPSSANGGRKYYAVTFGDIRLITLYVCRVWRLQNIGLAGKYSEIPGSSEGDYGGGDFIFESIEEGSSQLKFLDEELAKEDYADSRIKMVMMHEEAHSLGTNQIPAYTDPVAKVVTSPLTGQQMTIYDYPLDEDYVNKLIEPRLVKSGTDLLFEAHSHLWNRFRNGSMNILETSNVGNNYGAFDGSVKSRNLYPSALNSDDQYNAIKSEWDQDNYVTAGDPYGFEAIEPNEAALPGGNPYLASDTVTAFSILDTERDKVDSYYFDTEAPESETVLFDSFGL